MAPEKVPKADNDEETAEGGTIEDEDKPSVGDRVGSFFKKSFDKTKRQANEAQKDLKRSVGLGHKPNVIPPGKGNINGDQRTIELGWHPVAGATGKWFAEKTIIGRGIKEKVGKYPDPTQHWGVIVGDYVHQLWMDVNFNVIYINEKLKREEWTTFVVGKTRFNDQALRQASRMTIKAMRDKRPLYNLISNNCQNFATNLLDSVQLGAHREFATSFAVYQRATGEGDVLDLWDKHPEEQAEHDDMKVDEDDMPKPKRQNTVQVAQQVMDEHTTTLDDADD